MTTNIINKTACEEDKPKTLLCHRMCVAGYILFMQMISQGVEADVVFPAMDSLGLLALSIIVN
jgi:hypothetical protein